LEVKPVGYNALGNPAELKIGPGRRIPSSHLVRSGCCNSQMVFSGIAIQKYICLRNQNKPTLKMYPEVEQVRPITHGVLVSFCCCDKIANINNIKGRKNLFWLMISEV
jgi:hypothetical protein